MKKTLLALVPLLLLGSFSFAYAQTSIAYTNPYVFVYSDGSVSDVGGAGFDVCLDTPHGQVCGGIPTPTSANYPYNYVLDMFVANWGTSVATSSISTSTYACWSQISGGGCNPTVNVTIVNGQLLAVDSHIISTSDILSNQIALAYASSSSLFAGQTASDTLAMIQASCSQSGNAISDALCVAAAYLFVPDSSVINGFGNVQLLATAKFPFSWIYGVQADIQDQSASSSSNLPQMTFGLHDLGIGSTTAMGNILPNFDIFSTTTITYFMPAGWWDIVQFLIATALWLELIYIIFQDARRRFYKV